MFRRVANMLRNEIPNIIEKLLNEELTVRQNLTKFEEANKIATIDTNYALKLIGYLKRCHNDPESRYYAKERNSKYH